ncbi:MAG: methylornithine synthase PylB [Methanomassiliicoccaceae archaeon]|nr:methylornithine synthase PylB [Methanomassiliicoccaceae archaeon]
MYEKIFEKASEGKGLIREEIEKLLSIKDQDSLNLLFETARDLKRKHFGEKVFTYGFVYFSTFCRNNCSFCYYRRDNNIERYRKTIEETVSLSGDLQDSGVNLVDLTMGEDQTMHANDNEKLIEMVEKVNSAVSIPIMLSPGAVPEEAFPMFRKAGAEWFACYQETHNRRLFSEMRLEQDFDHRSNQRSWAKRYGMMAEDGIMVGIGETRSDIADSVIQMGAEGCEQIRTMTFVPQSGTPMSAMRKEKEKELKVMAIMRLAYPDRLIPASLDVEGIEGLIPRIRAGANIVTSIVPPRMHLAGVAQKELDIDSGFRSMEHVANVLEKEGCKIGRNSEYESMLRDIRRRRCVA